jgi:osmoprotectant transport system permease protein
VKQSIWQQITTYLQDYYTWNGPSGIPHQTGVSLLITLLAVAIAAVVALPVAVWLGHRGRGGVVATLIANATRSVPTYGLLVLFASFVVIGVGNRAAVLALAVFALAPLLTNANAGVRDVDPDAVDAARGMGMSGPQVLRQVELPLALPLIAAGMRTAVVQTFATSTLAAFVGGGGLGAIISLGAALNGNGYGQLIVGAATVAIVTLVLELAMGLVQALLTPRSQARRVAARLPRPGGREALTG